VSYSVQLAGSLVLAASAGVRIPLLLFGVTLLGCGVGNATSLPPLIAQREFACGDAQRVIARTIAISQGTYAFAPVVFGVLIGSAGHVMTRSPGAGVMIGFAAAALVQAAAAGSVMIGGRSRAAGSASSPDTTADNWTPCPPCGLTCDRSGGEAWRGERRRGTS
jgi:hypothetical protein